MAACLEFEREVCCRRCSGDGVELDCDGDPTIDPCRKCGGTGVVTIEIETIEEATPERVKALSSKDQVQLAGWLVDRYFEDGGEDAIELLECHPNMLSLRTRGCNEAV